MKYKLIIFDMDGTILDTLDDLAASLNHALTVSGYPARTTAEVRKFVGNGIRRLVERGVPEGTAVEAVDKVFDAFRAHYAVHCADKTRPYDGIADAINELKRRGCRVAVVSNKADGAVQELCRRYFEGMFDAAVGEREGVRKKPAPDSVNEVLRQLGCAREDAVYVGDSEVDIETGRNAGMPCITVGWGFRDRDFLMQNGADVYVTDTAELMAQLV